MKPRSLRAALLAWVLLPLAAALGVGAAIGHRNAVHTAQAVQDRLLLGAARIVAEQMRVEDGVLDDRIPPAALELFDARDADQIYYRVTTAGGRMLTGYEELALPAGALAPEHPRFDDAAVRGETVRSVAYLQPVVGAADIPAVTVQIAQTLHGRDAFARELWTRTLLQQLAIVVLAAALVVLGLRQALRPLLRLSQTVRARPPGSLEPLAPQAVSAELAPLVEALNDNAARLQQYAGAQRVFVQNAAHQLRTPLTLLTTQLSYALRADDAAGRAESLQAIRQTVQQAVRLVHQLLTLSAAEDREVGHAAAPVSPPVPLAPLVQGVLESLAGRAQARSIDLGLELDLAPGTALPPVAGDPLALREIVTNLVDNAIRYTPPGGIVTARLHCVDGHPLLSVEDNGPGIPEPLRERVFERFFRLDNGDSGGSGLGLPIVREFAARMGATVTLRTPAGGAGLAVDVRFAPATSG